jgi:hypothetical protein
MQWTQLSAVIVPLGVALAVAAVVWRGRVRRRHRENPEARCRRDIQALKRRRISSQGPPLTISGTPGRLRTPHLRGPRRLLPG